MENDDRKTFTAFEGHRRIAVGDLPEVALAAKRGVDGGGPGPVTVYSDETGQAMEFDYRGDEDTFRARLSGEVGGGAAGVPGPTAPRGPGRPRLGVVAREVTLLPRHWDWLNDQPGGASV